jgi:hypothetical protein
MGISWHRLQRDVLEMAICGQEKVVRKLQKALHKEQGKLRALKEQAHANDTLQINVIRNGKPHSRRPWGSCTDEKSLARNKKRREREERLRDIPKELRRIYHLRNLGL